MTNRIKIVLAFGARPNFVKIAPIIREWRRNPEFVQRFDLVLVHTGQHHLDIMSKTFIDQLEIGPIKHRLRPPGTGHARQTADIMVAFDEVCASENPDWVFVVGDVNTSVACALAAKKRGIQVAHIEAGLRSFNRAMPEEINRLAVDAISDLFFTTSQEATRQLRSEGIEEGRIHFVGNLMIDNLLHYWSRQTDDPAILAKLNASKAAFAFATLHRPSNVDEIARLRFWLDALRKVSKRIPVALIMHPRTTKKIEENGLAAAFDGSLQVHEPLTYLEMISVYRNARFVMTDSGGVQEEATAFGLPCLTLRAETERPETVTQGTNTIIGDDLAKLERSVESILTGRYKMKGMPEKWDDRVARRIFEVMLRLSTTAKQRGRPLGRAG